MAEPEEDEYEFLGNLLSQDTLHLDPLYRVRGLILFFSISLGALGLGASLAYFTRDPQPRPVRRPTRITRRVPEMRPSRRRLPASRKPRTREETPDLRTRLQRKLSEGPEVTAPGKQDRLPIPADPVLEAIASAALPTRKVEPVPGPEKAEPEQKTEDVAPEAEPKAGEKDPEPPALSTEVLGLAGAAMEGLAGVLQERYGIDLEWKPEDLTPVTRKALPRWTNLRYLEKLARSAIEAKGLESLEVTSEVGEFGAGKLRLRLPGGEEGGDRFLLELDKPKAASRVALIVDDVGYGGPSTRKLLDLPAPFSVAILPFYPGSSWAARTTLKRGLESMLHFPMQPKGAEGKYRKRVVVGRHLEAKEIRRRATRAMKSLPGISGLNNHMGSRATESWYVMSEVLPLVKDRGLFFVDSVTSNRSVAYRSARKMGVPTARRSTSFLDNDPSYEGVTKAFRRLLSVLKPGAEHVAILHDKPDSVRAMDEAIPQFRQKGVELVFAGEMVH